MTFRLPPLNALRLFEAASRHMSFRLAADELHVTPSAISHGIQVLEDWFGVPLFERETSGVRATAAGESYAPAVRQALDDLARATQELPGRKPSGSLSISVAPMFASKWLVPHLEKFTRRHPDINVVVDTAHRTIEFPVDGIDLAIRMAQRARPGGAWIRLVREGFVPVCSPDLQARMEGMGLEQALSQIPLIETTSVTESWREWADAAGVKGPTFAASLRFDKIQMSVDAAVHGLGIALGRLPLINGELESGKLVRLLPTCTPGKTSYWLVGSAKAFERSEVRLFRKWLIEEIRPPAGINLTLAPPCATEQKASVASVIQARAEPKALFSPPAAYRGK